MSDFITKNYIYIIFTVLIIGLNYLIWYYFKPYLIKKGLLKERDNLLIKVMLLLVVFALIYTYVKTSGTFIW